MGPFTNYSCYPPTATIGHPTTTPTPSDPTPPTPSKGTRLCLNASILWPQQYSLSIRQTTRNRNVQLQADKSFSEVPTIQDHCAYCMEYSYLLIPLRVRIVTVATHFCSPLSFSFHEFCYGHLSLLVVFPSCIPHFCFHD